ncbi:MAG: hypothetical protein M1553_01960, partial [Firmicutes bacterium]|nr:hypothetical protein [Bacillota bacterium]
MDSATPMQSQYLAIKREHQDKILFFRLGDFYEMFYEDAEVAARELEITLTSREGGRNQRVPMAGIPYHAADSYISRLIEKGYKIAICEQMEDPRLAKGLVRREVVRIITPGTAVDTRLLDDKSSNYLVSLAGSSQLVPREGAVTSPADAGRTGAPSLVDRPGSFSPDPSPVTKPVVPRDSEAFGLALVEASTGEFAVTEFSGPDALNRLLEELGRLEPRECLLAPTLQGHTRLNSFLKEQLRATVTPYRPEFYDPALARRKLLDQLQVVSLRGFGCDDLLLAIAAAGALLHYLEETQKTTLTHINRLRTYHPEEYMVLDAATRRHLELVRRFPDGARKGSLLWALDETVTAMGGRL